VGFDDAEGICRPGKTARLLLGLRVGVGLMPGGRHRHLSGENIGRFSTNQATKSGEESLLRAGVYQKLLTINGKEGEVGGLNIALSNKKEKEVMESV